MNPELQPESTDRSTCPARIGVVEDDAGFRRALERLLRVEGYAVRSFESAEEYLAAIERSRFECLLLDLQLPGVDGLSLQHTLVEHDTPVEIVFLSGQGSVPNTVEAIKHGAVDFLEKPIDDERLLEVLRQAIDRSFEQRRAREELELLRADFETLSPREADVLSGVVSGRLNKQIAGRLGIAEGTVKVHRGQVMRKMRADSLADLVRMAERLGIEIEESK